MRNRIVAAATLAAGTLTISVLSAPLAVATVPNQAASVETAAGVAVSAKSAGPKVKWDWTMPTFMKDNKTFVQVNDPSSQYYVAGGYYKKGADGIPDKPMKSVSGYAAAKNARYGKIPDDDLFKVKLDASKSKGSGKLRCSWHIKSDPGVKRNNRNCGKQLKVWLPEGKHDLTLEVQDNKGMTVVDSKIIVKNSLISIMGDSYSSGEGFPPFTEKANNGTGDIRMIDWDDWGCNRSRWSGFVRAAQTVESADKRSNVTLIDVACAGGEISHGDILVNGRERQAGGILYPQQWGYKTDAGEQKGYMPAQVDQLRKIAGKRPFDATLLSIGGNDVGFGLISQTCAEAGQAVNCYSENASWDIPDRPLFEAVDYLLDKLEIRNDHMAPCLSSDGGKKNCRTFKLKNGAPADKATKAKPVVMERSKDVLQAIYPDLTSTTNAAGQIIPCNAIGLKSPMNQISNSWAWNVAYSGKAGKTYTLPTSYSPPLPTPNPAAITPTADGLIPQFKQNGRDYGWTIGKSFGKKSRGHGLCADDNWLNPIIPTILEKNPTNKSAAEHPNEEGQAEYAAMLGPMTEDLTAVPVDRPASYVRSSTGLG